jgi:hypothetical protein
MYTRGDMMYEPGSVLEKLRVLQEELTNGKDLSHHRTTSKTGQCCVSSQIWEYLPGIPGGSTTAGENFQEVRVLTKKATCIQIIAACDQCISLSRHQNESADFCTN